MSKIKDLKCIQNHIFLFLSFYLFTLSDLLHDAFQVDCVWRWPMARRSRWCSPSMIYPSPSSFRFLKMKKLVEPKRRLKVPRKCINTAELHNKKPSSLLFPLFLFLFLFSIHKHEHFYLKLFGSHYHCNRNIVL